MENVKETKRRLLMLILAVVMAITSIGIVPTSLYAKTKEEKKQEVNYVGDGYTVNFKITSSWDGAFNANVTVKNTGDTVIDNWAMSFAMPYEITNIWNGTVEYNEEYIYIIKNAGYNQDISVGGSVSFGFTAEYEGEILLPNSFLMVMTEETLESDAYEVSINISSDWGTAFQGELIIENLSDAPIEDWKLNFEYPCDIEQFWTANISKNIDGSYMVKNAGYNSVIESGECLKLGFQATNGDATTFIENVYLNHIVVCQETLDFDNDNDGITNKIELYLGTNIDKVDTDEDGINDYMELYYDLNPLSIDSDNNSVLDGDEDLDSDMLTILEEFQYGTDNLREDTDGDGLTDYDEIYVYGTDPLTADTDNDGISDGSEIKIGMNPVTIDSDNDGESDSEEKVEQMIVQPIEDDIRKEIISVSVTMNGTGDISKTTTIENTYDKDIMSSEVVGLYGVPVEIKSTSAFDEATIQFTYDDALLGDVKEEDLRIMWYDEANNQYVIFDEESVLDTENNTISYTTTHFSTYLVVDRQAWYNVWSNALSYRRQPTNSSIPNEYFDICYVIDRSGSMSGTRIINAKEAITKFVTAMYDNDRGAIVSFDLSAKVVAPFMSNKEALKNALNTIYANGGTSVESGLVKAIDLFESTEPHVVNYVENSKMIVLLCDGDVYYTEETLERAKENHIKIYPVLIGSTSGKTSLEKIAEATGGTFYYAATAEEIREAIFGVQQDSIGEIDTTDTDGDGLYDIYEIAGMITPNGTYIYSDPEKRDTDGDGLTDAEEMGIKIDYDEQSYLKQFVLKMAGFENEIYAECFVNVSNPNKKDSDRDGYEDSEDCRPLIKDVWTVSLSDSERFVEIWDGGNNYYGGDQDWYIEDVAQDGACGTVAAANITAYMATKNDKYSDLYKYNDFSKSNFLKHMNDMYEYLSPYYIPFTEQPLGIWPMSKFKNKVEEFAEDRGVTLNGIYDESEYNKDNVIK